jgi:hypothetical protein
MLGQFDRDASPQISFPRSFISQSRRYQVVAIS